MTYFANASIIYYYQKYKNIYVKSAGSYFALACARVPVRRAHVAVPVEDCSYFDSVPVRGMDTRCKTRKAHKLERCSSSYLPCSCSHSITNACTGTGTGKGTGTSTKCIAWARAKYGLGLTGRERRIDILAIEF